MSTRFCRPLILAIALALGLLSTTQAAMTAAVKAEGNIRSEPRVAAATIFGQVCVGDRVTILETKMVSKATWYRVQVTLLSTGACKVSKHVASNTKGWVSSTILTKPTEAKDGSRTPAQATSTAVPQGQPPAQPTPKPAPTSTPEPGAEAQQCDPSYPDYCIPPDSPDLDCGDIPRKNITVLPPDPHRLDRDKDGIGCES
jgi:hypothetical protein